MNSAVVVGLSDNVYLKNYACGYFKGRNRKSTVIYASDQIARVVGAYHLYTQYITIKCKQSKLVHIVGCRWTLISAAMTKSIFKLFPTLLANVLFNTVMPKTHLSHPTDLV